MRKPNWKSKQKYKVLNVPMGLAKDLEEIAKRDRKKDGKLVFWSSVANELLSNAVAMKKTWDKNLDNEQETHVLH
jgi:hypothetical protein